MLPSVMLAVPAMLLLAAVAVLAAVAMLAAPEHRPQQAV
jgi:hypothetical protein